MSFLLSNHEKDQILAFDPKNATNDWVVKSLDKPVEEIQLYYHYKRACKKYPDQIFIYPGAECNKWGTRKYDREFLISRKATREECIDNHIRMRMHCSIYKSWEKLIEDEIRELAPCMTFKNRVFLDQLKQLSKKYILHENPLR